MAITGKSIPSSSGADNKINLMDDLKSPKSTLTKLRGVVDFGNLAQFDLYVKGFGLLAVISAPACMETKIQNQNTDNKDLGLQAVALQKSFVSILENEFRGLNGIDNLTADSSEISDGISTMNLITKVTEQGGSSITIDLLKEKSGRPVSKYLDMYLRCISDSRTMYKTYLGAIKTDTVEGINPGFDKEIFNLLYIVTDNTGLQIEGAYAFICSQPTESALSMLETERGSYDFQDISIPWNTFSVRSTHINKLAKSYVDHITIQRDSSDMKWSITNGAGVYTIDDNASATDSSSPSGEGSFEFGVAKPK